MLILSIAATVQFILFIAWAVRTDEKFKVRKLIEDSSYSALAARLSASEEKVDALKKEQVTILYVQNEADKKLAEHTADINELDAVVMKHELAMVGQQASIVEIRAEIEKLKHPPVGTLKPKRKVK
ncbi:MAG: hypothetical protein JO353_12990 [Phycisphaerae bacterium]|nr:hypothetical protein [Phycisphaerae bacterium]